MLNVRYELENLKANMSKTNTSDDLDRHRFWIQILQVYGPTRLFQQPTKSRRVQSNCSEKDIQTIDPIEPSNNLPNY